MSAPSADFIRVTYPQPHDLRARQILAAHPEIRTLSGHTPSTALFVVALVSLQLALAVATRQVPWWAMLLCAYAIGATIDHALWVLIHDCTHNLVFEGPAANRLLAVVANLPFVMPAAISFRKYHLLHHRHLGEPDLDADVPGPLEVKLIGRAAAKKAVWLLFFSFVQGVVRPMRLRRVRFFDGWTAFNLVFQIAFMAAFVALAGGRATAFLALSSFFAIGLHPFGARWIQEHYVFKEGQETYSYYGPLNNVCFNMGYHNEHHDLVTVPWSRLPRIRALAPEFYDNLYAHRSWTALLFQFITDGRVGPDRRTVRPSRAAPRP